ncbi:hypothetical protein E8E78_04835 [Pseudomonas sp. BN505]|nr:hypothetical protein [Pseudomonas sp. BN605]MDH4855931.1 hypothetical protein [Pseudomonas sp. BN505]
MRRKDVTRVIEISFSCCGPFAGAPAPTGISQGLGLCSTCGSGHAREEAGTAKITLDSASIKPFIAIIPASPATNCPHASPARQLFQP